MTLPLEVDATQFTRKRLMVTLRLPKAGEDQQPQVILEAEDGSGLAVALFGHDSPAARADAARMMALWNDALPHAEPAESPANDFPGKSVMSRDLPSNITIPAFDPYQVRIVRDGHEYSATFAWSSYGSKESALSEAVAWRDGLLAKLPTAATTLGSYRSTPQKNKRSYNRVGISRYIGVDRRKLGAPGYLRFAVNWVDDTGHSRVTSFQVGKVGAYSWGDELHAACTAEAFRTQWEFCRATGQSFDPASYEGWRHKQCYPFNPDLSDQGEHE